MKITIENANVTIEDGKVIINNIGKDVLLNSLIQGLSDCDIVKLSTLKPKDVFKIGDEEFIVLEQTDVGTKVISKDFAFNNKSFGDCSDWKQSQIRLMLNTDYYNKIAKNVGESNIIPMERDLTSLDGFDDYGTCTDKITLLSAKEYAKYHKILGLNSHYTNWWWTITPASTPSNGYYRRVCVVSPTGVLPWDGCECSHGVRPFLTLEYSIFVLKSEG